MWLGIFAEGGHAPRAGSCMTGRGYLHFKTDLLLVLFFYFQVTIACRIRWFEREDSTSRKEKTKQKTRATTEKGLGKSSKTDFHFVVVVLTCLSV